MTYSNKVLPTGSRLFIILIVVACLLLIPFITMQFSTEVLWSAFDFAVMGILLLGAGLAIDLVLRMVKKTSLRIILCACVMLALLLVWAELAVGLFGTPFAGN